MNEQERKAILEGLDNMFYQWWQDDVREGYTGSLRDWEIENESLMNEAREFYHVND